MRTVFTTDNGDTSFVVHLPFNGKVSTRPGIANILHKIKDEDILYELENVQRNDPKFLNMFVPWKSIKYTKAWIGLDPEEPSATTPTKSFFKRLLISDSSWWHGGSSMLLQTATRTFMYIGDCIFKFQLQPKDEVLRYVSRMGNNAVPYPYVVGRDNTYLLVAFNVAPIYIPNQLLDMTKDPYDQFFEFNLETGAKLRDARERNRSNDRFEKKHRVKGFKLLHKRLDYF